MSKRIKMHGELISDDWGEIYDYYGITNTTPHKIRSQLEAANGEDIIIEVDSPGGDVTVGSQIYYMLAEYNGRTQADITGMACSAATFAVLSADKVRMVPSAFFMIHQASTVSAGNTDKLSHDAGMLKTCDKGLADVYAEKTGLEKDFILALMKEETWMNAQDAFEYGFVDEVITPERLVAGFGIISDMERKKMKSEFNARKAKEKARAFFNLLKLREV